MSISSSTDVARRIELPGDDVAGLSGAELGRRFCDRSLSPVEVATAFLARAERVDGALRAFSHFRPDETLAMARASEARWSAGAPAGPLDGVPVTIKDLVAVRGWPLGRGSPAMVDDPPAAEDAPVAARLREAGMVFLARTTSPDAGCSIAARNLVQGVTLNPFDPSRSPGGSSGGAAVGLACGVAPLALGTDGAGSVRIPAAWTGVFGLKPSFGRVPAYPPSVFAPHAVSGPMARTVDDAALLLEQMARPDPRDAFALDTPFSAAQVGRVEGLRIGVTLDFGVSGPALDPDLAGAVMRAADVLAAEGATVTPVAPQWPVPPLDPFMTLWEATYAGFLDTAYPPEKMARMDPTLLTIAARGRQIGMAAYHRALAGRAQLRTASKLLFDRFDLLLGPVMPCPPPLACADAPPGFEPGDWSWCPYTYLWNMTGQPAASAPMGLDSRGLPQGVQIVGWVGSEPSILAAAKALEEVTPAARPDLAHLQLAEAG